MLYLQSSIGTRPVALLFSTSDSLKEIQRFLRLIHAPFRALHVAHSTSDRTRAELYAKPRELAIQMIEPSKVFSSPVERVLWELKQPGVCQRHKHPWGLPDNPTHEEDNR